MPEGENWPVITTVARVLSGTLLNRFARHLFPKRMSISGIPFAFRSPLTKLLGSEAHSVTNPEFGKVVETRIELGIRSVGERRLLQADLREPVTRLSHIDRRPEALKENLGANLGHDGRRRGGVVEESARVRHV